MLGQSISHLEQAMSETFTIDGYTVKIEPEDYPLNPRTEFDNVSEMVCWHRRYNLGDKQPTCSPDEYLHKMMSEREYRLHRKFVPEEIKQEDLKAYIDKHFLVLPLYLYDHSGLSISTESYSCPWDSGQVGFIYVERENTEYSDPEAGLRGEVKTYDQYLQGDVWRYIIEAPDGEILDSCSGFYGFDHCKSEAKHIVSGYPVQLAPCT